MPEKPYQPPKEANATHRRQRVEQLTANELPGHVPVFQADDRGALTFRIRKRSGKLLPGYPIRVSPRQRLNAAWLSSELKRLGS